MFRINVESGQINELANVPFPFDTGVLIGQCGSATRADGSQVVVFAGGVEAPNDISSNIAVTTSYIYDVDGDFWTPGPSLPEPRTWGRAVQYQNTFVIVGGGDDFFGDPSSFVSSIVRYDPDGQEWEVLEQQLEDPDYANVALIAPPGFNAQCSQSRKNKPGK